MIVTRTFDFDTLIINTSFPLCRITVTIVSARYTSANIFLTIALSIFARFRERIFGTVFVPSTINLHALVNIRITNLWHRAITVKLRAALHFSALWTTIRFRDLFPIGRINAGFFVTIWETFGRRPISKKSCAIIVRLTIHRRANVIVTVLLIGTVRRFDALFYDTRVTLA